MNINIFIQWHTDYVWAACDFLDTKILRVAFHAILRRNIITLEGTYSSNVPSFITSVTWFMFYRSCAALKLGDNFQEALINVPLIKWVSWKVSVSEVFQAGIVFQKVKSGRNIVGQQLSTLLDIHMLHLFAHAVACCWVLLGVVAQSFKPVKLEPTTPSISFAPWSPQSSTTMFGPFSQLFQHCWGHARALHMVSLETTMQQLRVKDQHAR